MLQGITQQAVGILEPSRTVNPLSNWHFVGASTLLIVLVGWYITDRIIKSVI